MERLNVPKPTSTWKVSMTNTLSKWWTWRDCWKNFTINLEECLLILEFCAGFQSSFSFMQPQSKLWSKKMSFLLRWSFIWEWWRSVAITANTYSTCSRSKSCSAVATLIGLLRELGKQIHVLPNLRRSMRFWRSCHGSSANSTFTIC